MDKDIHLPKFCFEVAPELLDLIVQGKVSRRDSYTGCSSANGVCSLFQSLPSPPHQAEARPCRCQSPGNSLSYTASSPGNNRNLI